MRPDARVATLRAEGPVLVQDTAVRLGLRVEFAQGVLVGLRVVEQPVLPRVHPPPLPRPPRDPEDA